MPVVTKLIRSLTLVSMLVFSGSLLAQDVPPVASLKFTGSSAKPGETVKAILTIKFAPGLHGYQNPPPEEFMIPVTVKSADGAQIGDVSYPAGTMEMVAGQLAAVYSNEIEIGLTLVLPKTAGERTIKVTTTYQQCDESACFMPSSVTAEAKITVVGEAQTATPPKPPVAETKANPEPEREKTTIEEPDQTKQEPETLSSQNEVVTQEAPAQSAPKTETDDEGGLLGFLNRALADKNWALIVPAALLVGLALCLTPCVFPMIPVTISFFANQPNQGKSTRAFLGVFYALGIAVTYGAVGGVSAALGGAVGDLFTKSWFALSLALLLIALALSMFDLYEIRLPSFLQKQLKGRSGVVGALIMGLLMGFAAAPCAGALVGAVAVKVAEIGSVPTGVGMFGLVGLGMGLPFMVLATVSSGAKALPKSGGWLKTVKAVLGFVVLAIAFGYLFQAIGLRYDDKRIHLAWIAVYGGFAVYLFGFDHSGNTKAITTIKGVVGIALGFLAGQAYSSYKHEELEPLVWVPYTQKALADAAASGKPILIDGKADWCLQCREIEERVFDTPDGRSALKGVYLMSVDWSTGVDPKYIAETKSRFKITGLPNIVFMEPGGKNEFTVKKLESVDELRSLLRKVGAGR